MPDPSPPGASQLSEAIAAIKAGDKAKGRKLLTLFLQTNPTHENAILWMSATTSDPKEKQRYFERVLQLNPNNEKAKQALAKLGAVGDEEPPLEALTDSPAKPAKIRRLATDASPIKTAPVKPAKPKNSSNAALWVTLLIIIACCPVLGLASVISSESRPAAIPPTEAPAPDADTPPEPQPAVSEREAYLVEVRNNLTNIKTGLDELIKVMGNAQEVEDEELFSRVIASVAFIQLGHENLTKLTPPKDLEEAHGDLLYVTGSCSETTEQFTQAIDNSDITEFQLSLATLVGCQDGVNTMLSSLSGDE